MRDKNSWVKASLQASFGLTSKRLELVLDQYESLDQAIEDNFLKLKNTKNNWLEKFDTTKISEKAAKIQEQCENENIRYICIDDQNYPQSLLSLHTPPVGFFYKGDLDLFQSRFKITIVGSRSVSNLAEAMINSIIRPAISSDITIVSGLAYGIDTLAHKIAVSQNHKTLAVIGSGLDKQSFYPKENLNLGDQILAGGGLIISEYGPLVQPNRFTFPARNRILAAISNLTIVVQASLKSGTLITAGAARDLGKTVATFPVSPFEKSFAGNLELIKNGANVITESQDIIDLLGINQMLNNQESQKTFNSDLEAEVYKQLDITPITIDDLVEKMNISLSDLQMHLTMLEMSGYVRSAGNNQWLIIR